MIGGAPGEPKDPYTLLRVPRGASDTEIRRAYRRLIVQTHRARVIGIVEEIDAIKSAYETLKDPARRHIVDATPPPTYLPFQLPPRGPSPELIELQFKAARDVQRHSQRLGERAAQQHAGTLAEIGEQYDGREAALRRALKRRTLVLQVIRTFGVAALVAAVFAVKNWLGL